MLDRPFSEQSLMRVLKDALALKAEAPYVARIEVPVAETALRPWLAMQAHVEKTYWRDRDGVFETAGLGAADCLSANGHCELDALFARVAPMLTFAHPHLRYYGGFRFDPARTTHTPWETFGTYRFVLPRFELLRTGTRMALACNALIRCDKAADRQELETIAAEYAAIRWEEAERVPNMPVITERSDMPDRAAWTTSVGDALRACAEARLDKVVLARKTELCMEGVLEPWDLLERIAAGSRDAYLFCFQPQAGMAFLGASPERLWKRAGGYVQSEAVAGTRPRGISSSSDAELGDALLHNDKELREHRFVAEGVHQVLQVVCDAMREDDEVSLIRLPNCQHIARRYEGLLADGYEDLDLLRVFHPTPAVGGVPTDRALAWIRETEPFDRGWYAGPVGWIGYDSSEFAVAIRSGLITGNRVHAFAGAGIVPGSQPAAEWDELDSKIQPFLEAVNHDDNGPR